MAMYLSRFPASEFGKSGVIAVQNPGNDARLHASSGVTFRPEKQAF
jgi:hypothetical protein